MNCPVIRPRPLRDALPARERVAPLLLAIAAAGGLSAANSELSLRADVLLVLTWVLGGATLAALRYPLVSASRELPLPAEVVVGGWCALNLLVAVLLAHAVEAWTLWQDVATPLAASSAPEALLRLALGLSLAEGARRAFALRPAGFATVAGCVAAATYLPGDADPRLLPSVALLFALCVWVPARALPWAKR